MLIKWKSNKATVEHEQGSLEFTLKKFKGIQSMTLYSGERVLKSGLQSKNDAADWLKAYLKGLK